jgi:hypothetical protein
MYSYHPALGNLNSINTRSASELGGLGVGNRRRRSKTGWADESHAEAEGARAFGRIIQQINSCARGHYAVMTPEQRAGRWRAACLTLHDGLTDGTEDSDANGLQTFGETDPNDPDTDGDGLADGWIDQKVWNSSSQQFESCADGTSGVFDAWEGEDSDKDGEVDKDANETMLETSAITRDSDGDGLWDGDEVKPEMISEDDVTNLNEYVTDALKSDTDNDGISDYMEISGWYMSTYWEETFEVRKDTYMVYSDPTDSDTDNDGLLDGDEYVYTGDPSDTDSDDDGVDDRFEVNVGSKPGNSDGIPPEINSIDCWVDPIVGTGSNGVKFLSGIKIKVTMNASDSSGVHYIELEINNKVARRYLQDSQLQTNVTNEIINISTDYPFAKQDRLIIKIVDFCGNVKEIALIPNDYWPNFRGQNWVDPKVEFTLATTGHEYKYDDIKLLKELPYRMSTEIRGVYKRAIRSLYQSIKIAYNNIFNNYIKPGIYNTLSYVSALETSYMDELRFGGVFLYSLIKTFRSGNYDQIKNDVTKLSNSDDQYFLYLHSILKKLVNDFNTLESNFLGENTIVWNKIVEFFTSTSKIGCLPNYLNNNWGNWWLKCRDGDGVPNILKISQGTYQLYSVNSNHHEDMDQDGITDYDEFKVIFRVSNDAYGNYDRGWIDVWISYNFIDRIVRCNYINQRNFYFTRDYTFTNREFLRTGFTSDNKQYFIFYNRKWTGVVYEPLYSVYIILSDKGGGHFNVAFYKSDNLGQIINDWTFSPFPNAIHYHTEERLCPDANLIIRDIFIEVDWMSNGPKYYYWNDNQYFYIYYKGSIEHQMPPKVKQLIENNFKKHGIVVHFDDGTEKNKMSGGGPIEYKEKIKEKDEEFKINYYGVYFSPVRKNTYRYSLICHYYEDDWGVNFPQTNPYTQRRYIGYSDRFTIAAQKVQDDEPSNVIIWTQNFMHEFGHSLGLWHPYDNWGPGGVDGRQKGWESITCMYQGLYEYTDYAINNPQGRAVAGYRDDPYNLCFARNEWDYIDLTWGLNF